MGFLDKAKDLLGDHSAEVEAGVDQAADLANEKTGGQFESQIDQGAEVAKDQIGNFLEGDQQA